MSGPSGWRSAALGGAAVLWIAAAGGVTAEQTFTSRIEAVRLDVLVTADGQPVKGLRAADFEVRDNGVPQQIDLVSFEEIPLNVVLTLDLSDSVTEQGLAHLRLAGGALLQALEPGDRAGVITFSHLVARRSPLSTDRGAVRAALDAATPAGHTALIDASHAALTMAPSPGARGLAVVFSDGVDTSSWLTSQLVLGTARRSEVVVYGVAVGHRVTEDFLHELTEATGGRLFQLQSTERLRSTFLEILEEFRHRYLLSYTPTGVSRTGWHRLQVRVKGRTVSIKTRSGYLAGS